MVLTVGKIAALVGGDVRGNAATPIEGFNSIDKASQGDITFLSNEKYLKHLNDSTASAILMHPKSYDVSIEQACILVDNVYVAIADTIEALAPFTIKIPVDTNLSHIAETAHIGEDVKIGVFTTISREVEIGDNTKIHAHVFVGEGVTIGKGCIIYPGVRLYDNVHIGDNVIIHANAVIGSDGFGFAPQRDGTFKKIPQIGDVIIENNVEIGANTVIDRAAVGSTIIREGVKLDNLIQVAHNVEIGAHTVMAAQVGVAGSTKLGKHCQVGGQAGIVGHLNIADQTRIQAQSGMIKSVKEPGTKWYGYPAIDYNNYLKSFAIYKNLPDLQSRIKELEKRLQELQQSLDK
ncbi:MAG: UDP-3-O-(3-hydroxymyristoyl)glucosamine N-acyltransferase [Saprospiraceae bacterium]|nr:UDP-3-O-(3-hydroxymyristoyl)glucosamine N-acyltransferase [Saprospiraceae bacterium]